MNKHFLFCSIMLLWLLVVQSAFGGNVIVAVSPYMEPGEAKQYSIKLLEQLTQLELGTQVTLLDGYHLSIIGEFNIPNNPAYKNPKAILGVNRAAVSALMRFADKAITPGTQNHPSVTGAVRLPQLLRYVANNYAPDERLDVVVLGSPFYDDPREAAFSMAGGRFPSDAHLFASQGKTPFGAANHGELLKNIHVHIGFGGERIMQSERHRYFVERFWTLYVEQLGGKLTSFVGDLPTLFRRVSQSAVPPRHDYKPVRSNKLEMIRLRPQAIKQSIYDRPISTSPLTQTQIRRAENVKAFT